MIYHTSAARSRVTDWARYAQLVECAAPPTDNPFFCLWHDAQQLSLLAPSAGFGTQLKARLASVELAELRRRLRGPSLLQQACGDLAGARVLDAMAGWGLDGLVLAAKGAYVKQCEVHPILHLLLLDLQQRARSAGLLHGHSEALLADSGSLLDAKAAETTPIDVVYLDPMFPARRKGALPGKRLQWLAQLAPPPPQDPVGWIDAALAAGARRVVLKRRRKDPSLSRACAWSVTGRTSRFDVFVPEG